VGATHARARRSPMIAVLHFTEITLLAEDLSPGSYIRQY